MASREDRIVGHIVRKEAQEAQSQTIPFVLFFVFLFQKQKASRVPGPVISTNSLADAL